MCLDIQQTTMKFALTVPAMYDGFQLRYATGKRRAQLKEHMANSQSTFEAVLPVVKKQSE